LFLLTIDSVDGVGIVAMVCHTCLRDPIEILKV